MRPRDSGPMDEPARPNPCQGHYRPGRHACGALLRSESLGQKARHFNRESAAILVQCFRSVKSAKACRAFLAVLMRTQDLRGSFLSTRVENCSSDTWSKREGGAVRWALNMGDLLNAKLTCDKRAGSGYFRYIVVSHPVQAARPTNLATKGSVKDERKLRPSRPFHAATNQGSYTETPPRLDAIGG